MSLLNKSAKTYNSSVAILSALTLLSGISTVFLGYITFPFAASFFAMLLCCESSGKRRIFSYVVPMLVFIVNIVVGIVTGSFFFECLAFVIIGFLLYFMYSHRVGKAETVFTLVTVLFCFILFPFCLLYSGLTTAFPLIKRLSISEILMRSIKPILLMHSHMLRALGLAVRKVSF